MEISKIMFLHRLRINKKDDSVDEKGMMHPAVQVYIWVCLALLTQILNGQLLMLIAGLAILLSIRICALRFLILLRRTRWILLSVLLIYSYTSPGDALWPQLGAFSPIADGVADGMLQLLRLVTVLAGLSVLLTLLSQTQLIAGIYILSGPVTFLGFSRDRVAVRLALTLRYAESAMQETANNWRDSIEQLLAPVSLEPGYIELHIVQFTRLDWLLAAAVSAVLLGVWF